MKKNLYILLLMIIVTLPIYAAKTNDVAIVLKHRGYAKIGIDDPIKWHNAKKAMRLNSGNVVRTKDDGYVAIMFSDDKSLLKIRENSLVAIGGQREKASVSKRLRCNIGQIWVKVKKQKTSFQVETPSGTATVKGTEFYEIIERNGKSTIICIEGLILFVNKFGKILIKAGETGIAFKNSAPTKHDTKSSDIPNWGSEMDDNGELEFEFEDADGKKKVLKIEYENK